MQLVQGFTCEDIIGKGSGGKERLSSLRQNTHAAIILAVETMIHRKLDD
jgi:hypothetical protein